MTQMEPPEDLEERARQAREEYLQRFRQRWDSLSPAERRAQFSTLERWSRRWREQDPDTGVNNAVFLTLVLFLVVIVLVLGGVIWLVVFLLS